MGNDEKVSPRSSDPVTPEIVGPVPSKDMDERVKEVLERAEDTLENGPIPPSGKLVSYQLLVGIREQVLRAPVKMSVQRIASELVEFYPKLKPSSLRVYCLLARNTTAHLMTLYGTKKISYIVLKTLSTPKLDAGTKDFLGNEVVERGFTPTKIREIRDSLKGGSSLSEAIKKASGEIPDFAQPGEVRKVVKQFQNIVREVSDLSLHLRMKMAMAVDLLPVTILDRGEVHSKIFYEAYLLRHVFKENFDVIDAKVKLYMGELRDFMVTESTLDSDRQTGGSNEQARPTDQAEGTVHFVEEGEESVEERETGSSPHDA